MKKHNVDCMVCGEPLIYMSKNTELKCEYCEKTVLGNVSCKNNHYVCDECHSKDSSSVIIDYCLSTAETNPIDMALKLMKNRSVNMHGPEHHLLVPLVLLTSYYNTTGDFKSKEDSLKLAFERGTTIPGGICGNFGNCGAAVGTGLFMSVLSGATPLTSESWSLSNRLTGLSLIKMADHGGPRCCKRNVFLGIIVASKFVQETYGVELYDYRNQIIQCNFTSLNSECLKSNCLFHRDYIENKL